MGTLSARHRNRRGEGELLRETLLEAASELLVEVGDADKLTVRGVTARAGVSPTALYLHFADVAELCQEVKDRAFAALRQDVRAAANVPDADPQEQLRLACLAYLRFAADRPGHYRVLFATRRRPPGPSREIRPEPSGGAFGDLVRQVGRCLPPERDAFAVATMVWAGLHGRVSLAWSLPRFPMPSAEVFVDGLIEAWVGSSQPLSGGG